MCGDVLFSRTAYTNRKHAVSQTLALQTRDTHTSHLISSSAATSPALLYEGWRRRRGTDSWHPDEELLRRQQPKRRQSLSRGEEEPYDIMISSHRKMPERESIICPQQNVSLLVSGLVVKRLMSDRLHVSLWLAMCEEEDISCFATITSYTQSRMRRRFDG